MFEIFECVLTRERPYRHSVAMNDAPLDKQPAAGSGRQYFVVFVGLFGQLVIQLLLQKLLTSTLGAGVQLDAYRFSLTLPMSIGAMLAGTISPIIIPIFGRNNSTESRATGGFIVTLAIASSLLIAGSCFVFSSQVIAALQAGNDPKLRPLTNDVFRILIWLLPVNALIGIVQSLLNAKLNFRIPVIAGIAGPLCTVIGYWIFSETGGAQVIAWATLTGGIVNLLIQFPALFHHIQFSGWRVISPQLRAMLWLGLPVLMVTFLQSTIPLVDKYVLSSPRILSGSIGLYDLSFQFLNAFIMLASGTLSTVAFPRIARKAFGDKTEFTAEIALALRGLILLVVPAVSVLFFFGEPLIEDIFESGAFLHRDTIIVGHLLQTLTFLLIGASLGELCAKTMYAAQDTRTPLIIASTVIVIASIFKLYFVPIHGIQSLALITTLTYVISSSASMVIITRRVGWKIYHGTPTALILAISGTACACLTGLAFLQSDWPYNSVIGLIAGAALYFGIIGAASREVREMLTLLCAGFSKQRTRRRI